MGRGVDVLAGGGGRGELKLELGGGRRSVNGVACRLGDFFTFEDSNAILVGDYRQCNP